MNFYVKVSMYMSSSLFFSLGVVVVHCNGTCIMVQKIIPSRTEGIDVENKVNSLLQIIGDTIAEKAFDG